MSIRIVTAVTRLQAGLLQKGRVVLNHEPEFMVKRVDQVEAVPAPGPTRSGLNGQLVAGAAVIVRQKKVAKTLCRQTFDVSQ